MAASNIVNLVVVAHPDDEVLGFGGTGAQLLKRGEIVQAVILCGDVNVRSNRPKDDDLFSDMQKANQLLGFNEPVVGDFPNMRMNTVDHIEIVQFIERQILKFQPTRIFTHHPGDLNDDHIQTSKGCMAASRCFQRGAEIIPLQSLNFMEILSSTDWSFSVCGQQFLPNTFFDIESTIDLKISALREYRNVMRDSPHPRSVEILRGHAAYRGGQCGIKFAESFQTIFRVGF